MTERQEITEDYVGFYTAQLLNKEGFDVPTATSFDKDGNIKDAMSLFHPENGDIRRPTLQMVRKWLRLKFNIHIEVRYNRYGNNYVYRISSNPLLLNDRDSYPIIFHSYEDAEEAAIKECIIAKLL